MSILFVTLDHATSNSLKATVNNEDRAASSNKKNAKKFTTINTSNFHWGVGKSIHHPMKHDDKKSNKTITVETSSGKKQSNAFSSRIISMSYS